MTGQFKYVTIIGALLLLASAGCSNDSNPISAFQPEIVNKQDSFQFQITDARHVTTSLAYQWNNSGTQATVDHSTALTAGQATLTLFDADSNQVYSSGLMASANEPTQAGTAGVWTVVVVFVDFSGTANFRLQKL
jgi:hypothetical protein